MTPFHKDAPAVGDVHVLTTGGRRRQRKAPHDGPIDITPPDDDDDDEFDGLIADLDKADDDDKAAIAALAQALSEAAEALAALGDDDDETAPTPTASAHDDFEIPLKIAKADADQQLIFGWASVVELDGQLIVDKQGDAILAADLEKAAYDFVLNARVYGQMHQTVGAGRLIESMVFTAEKQAALGIELGKVGWWVGFRVDDAQTWAALKRGELPEFSIGGSGRRVEA